MSVVISMTQKKAIRIAASPLELLLKPFPTTGNAPCVASEKTVFQ